jgi:hypothetical protein
LYPADRYPDGQWDYYRFYLTHFDQTVSDMGADIAATLASIYRPGNPASAGKVSPSALITANGGRYGSAHRAPPTAPDPSLWPSADFDALVDSFRATGFRPGNAWYLNDTANGVYAHTAPGGGRQVGYRQIPACGPHGLPKATAVEVGDWDAITDLNRSRLGEPMRSACGDLTVTNLPAGHWLPLERKSELVQTIRSWVSTKRL